MPVSRGRAVRAAGLTALLALVPAVAACGGSGGNDKVAASASVGTNGAQVSVSTSAMPSVSVTGSNGALQVGRNVTLTGTVSQVLIPGGYIFVMDTTDGSGQVAVGAFTGSQVKAGDAVTVQGTVTSVNVAQLTQQFGSQLTPDAKAQLQKLNGKNIVNATSVAPGGAGGASGSVTPSPSASG